MKVPVLSKLWKDPVWGSVIAGLILAAFAYFKGWWPNISGAFLKVVLWAAAKSLAPNWLLILLWVLALGFVGCIIVIAMMLRGKTTANLLSYTTDTFFEIKWRWTYEGSRINKLAPFCPKCDYQIIPKTTGYRAAPQVLYECEDCDAFVQAFDLAPEEIENKIVRMIQKKLRAQIEEASASEREISLK